MARHSTDRDRTRRDRQHLAEPASRPGHEPVHYGKKFAETEAHLRAKTSDPRPPEGSRSDDHLGSTDAQVSHTPAQASSGATASETARGPAAPGRGQRSSAPPPAEDGLAMVVTFGTDAVDAFRRLGEASQAVVLLPVRAARMVLRLGTSWIRGSPGRA
jgi:hypothetical protein